jgi:hypothetical protein
MSSIPRDRYISFEGLECDENAIRIVASIHGHLQAGHGGEKWHNYFTLKFSEQQRMATDELFFVGSQMNTLYDFFSEVGDGNSARLLYQVEQECC